MGIKVPELIHFQSLCAGYKDIWIQNYDYAAAKNTRTGKKTSSGHKSASFLALTLLFLC